MKLTLKIWRQDGPADKGGLHTYELDDVSEDMSFLEMLDVLDEQLIEKGEEPIAFDSAAARASAACAGDDQRRRARPRGHRDLPAPHAPVHRRRDDHDRAVACRRVPGAQGPRGRPLGVRRMIAAGALHLGRHRLGPEAHSVPAPATTRCARSTSPPASAAAPGVRPVRRLASLFMGAKITHLGELPRTAGAGHPVVNMVAQHDHEGFGGCTNIGQCTAACPRRSARRDLAAQQGPAHRDAPRPLSHPVRGALPRSPGQSSGRRRDARSAREAFQPRRPSRPAMAKSTTIRHGVGDPVARGTGPRRWRTPHRGSW